MNQRVYESKVRISETFFRLLDQSDFNEITISEIAAYSEVSRNTFYRNFTSKYSLVEFFIEHLLNNYFMKVQQQKVTNIQDLLTIYFEFWKQNQHYLHTLKKQQLLGLAFDVERKVFLKVLPDFSLPWHQQNDMTETYIDLIIVGGVWNILLHLMERKEDFDVEQIVQGILRELSFYKTYLP